MSLAKFRQKYPQGSLVSELIEIDRGTYIVKVLVRTDEVILATGLAGAATVEAAEDAARERAIATLFLDGQSSDLNLPASDFAPVSPNPPAKKSAPVVKNTPEPINSQAQSQPVKQEQPLTPVTVPLKPVVEAAGSETKSETKSQSEPESISENTLFGDTFNAESPNLEPIEDNRDSTEEEQNPAAQELEAMDFNEIKQKTDIEIKRLSWTKEQGKEFLMSRYGKRSRLHLTDEQLLEFLRYLETLPNPVK